MEIPVVISGAGDCRMIISGVYTGSINVSLGKEAVSDKGVINASSILGTALGVLDIEGIGDEDGLGGNTVVYDGMGTGVEGDADGYIVLGVVRAGMFDGEASTGDVRLFSLIPPKLSGVKGAGILPSVNGRGF